MLVFCKFNKLIPERQLHAPPEVFTVEAGVHISTELCTGADWLRTFALVSAAAGTDSTCCCLFVCCVSDSFFSLAGQLNLLTRVT